MENYLQQGIMAAKTGDRPLAFNLLSRASDVPATSEQAWLWLSSVVNDDAEKLYCLDYVLKINSDNTAARRGGALLRQKGVFPAVPAYPEPQRPAMVQNPTSRYSTPPFSSHVEFTELVRTPLSPTPGRTSEPKPTSTIETSWNKQELSGLFQYALMELTNKKTRQAVEKSLVSRGASAEAARMIVKDARYVIKKERREKYTKRLRRGLVWTVAGVAITLGTYAFAGELGGKFVLFYGAIIFGFIDFMVGLVGWLANA
jgi:hypothetical protein